MEQSPHSLPNHHIQETKPTAQNRSLFSLLKKYPWQIVVFFIIAITSGVLLADHEAKSTANWETFTSKEAGISFKHPQAFKIIEDKGWRITAYTSEQQPENNIKILYSHADPTSDQPTTEEQFLANCQAKRVSEITADNTRIKVYEDSTCGGQVVENSVIVYAENGMTYDIGLFGKIDRAQLYQFLSTFSFDNKEVTPTAGNKTYNDELFGITFAYPDNWDLTSSAENEELLEFTSGAAPMMLVTKINNPDNLTLEQLDRKLERTTDRDGTTNPGLNDPTNKEISIAGMKGYFQESYLCEPSICERYIFITDRHVYTVLFYQESKTNSAEIISTFTFTNPQNTAMNNVPTCKASGTESSAWSRKQFETSWDISYPSNWVVSNDNGLEEGYLEICGPYKKNVYQITMSYPLGDNSLNEAVTQILTSIPEEKKEQITVLDMKVNGILSKELIQLPMSDWNASKQQIIYTGKNYHAIFIEKSNDRNARDISIQLLSGTYDSQQMQELLELFAAGVK